MPFFVPGIVWKAFVAMIFPPTFPRDMRPIRQITGREPAFALDAATPTFKHISLTYLYALICLWFGVCELLAISIAVPTTIIFLLVVAIFVSHIEPADVFDLHEVPSSPIHYVSFGGPKVSPGAQHQSKTENSSLSNRSEQQSQPIKRDASTQTGHAKSEPHAVSPVEERLRRNQDASTQTAHTAPRATPENPAGSNLPGADTPAVEAPRPTIDIPREPLETASNAKAVEAKPSFDNLGSIEKAIASLASDINRIAEVVLDGEPNRNARLNDKERLNLFRQLLSKKSKEIFSELSVEEDFDQHAPIPIPTLEVLFSGVEEIGLSSWIDYDVKRDFEPPSFFQNWVGKMPEAHRDSQAKRMPNFDHNAAKAELKKDWYELIPKSAYISKKYPGVWALEDEKAFRVFQWVQQRQVFFCLSDMIGIGFPIGGEADEVHFFSGPLDKMSGKLIWNPAPTDDAEADAKSQRAGPAWEKVQDAIKTQKENKKNKKIVEKYFARLQQEEQEEQERIRRQVQQQPDLNFGTAASPQSSGQPFVFGQGR